MAFASPAALSNVVATADDPAATLEALGALRLVFSAGAPVPAETLRAVHELTPSASLHTPYGMTEALPVADIDLAGIERAEGVTDGSSRGVCVGKPVDGCEVQISALGFDALDGVPDPVGSGQMGEILVRSAWVSGGYLGRWSTQRAARPGGGWHRTGDVGQLDESGQLWVDGRAVHVIAGVDGPLAPVPIERCVERALAPEGVVQAGRVAAVGVGPEGVQQAVVVIEGAGPAGLATDELSRRVRDAAGVELAAVLTVPALPVDIRHNAKIDRAEVAAWAAAVLAGGPMPAAPGERRRLGRRT